MRIFPTCLPLAAAAFLLSPLGADAQSPRMMLVEEGTNASCGPCASQNPFFESYLRMPHNVRDVIPIVYHANWPGLDVMNAANPTMHNTRVSYYGFDGVPTVMVNGRIPKGVDNYDGAPADTAGIVAQMSSVRGTISPITLDMRQTIADGALSVSITVSSTEAQKNRKLRIVLVEGHHNYTSPAAGYNGETDFHFIAREMRPSPQGVDLSLDAGGSTVVNESFTLNSSWDDNQMYVVAFVQDDASKEILQAGSTRGTLSMKSAAQKSVVQTPDSDHASWDVDLGADVEGEYGVSIDEALPKGWTAEVTVNGSVVSGEDYISLGGEEFVPMAVKITPNSTEAKLGVGEVTVGLHGPRGASSEQTFRLYSDDIDVLVVNRDEGREDVMDFYMKGLARGPYVYAPIAPEDEAMFDVNRYPVLLYEVGKNALTVADVRQLTSFMEKGGRLFLSGAEISFGLGDSRNTDTNSPQNPAFMRNSLHVDYVADAAASFVIKGAANDPLSNGMSFLISNGVQNQDQPDVIAPLHGAVPILFYGGDPNAVAGIRYADAKNRLVYLGFGVEGIGDILDRADLLEKGLTWLMGTETTTGVEDPAASLGPVGALRPNPVRDLFEVALTLDREARVSASLYDMRGSLVGRLVDGDMEAGAQVLRHDTRSLPAGLYNLVVTVDGTVYNRPVTVVR